MRWTALTLIPVAFAIIAPVQWVASVGGVDERQGHHALDHRGAERCNPRGPRLVAQKAVEPFLHEAFLPTPDTGLRLPRPTHDLDGAEPFGGQQDDRRSPSMLLWSVAALDEGLKPTPISRRDDDGYPGAHAPDSHATPSLGIPRRTPSSDFVH